MNKTGREFDRPRPSLKCPWVLGCVYGDGEGAWRDSDAVVFRKSLGLGKWAPKGKGLVAGCKYLIDKYLPGQSPGSS